jgi:hypothetical protein
MTAAAPKVASQPSQRLMVLRVFKVAPA